MAYIIMEKTPPVQIDTSHKSPNKQTTHGSSFASMALWIISVAMLVLLALLWQRMIFIQSQAKEKVVVLSEQLKKHEKKWQTQDQTNTMLFNQFSSQTRRPEITQQKIEQNLSMAIWQLAFFKNRDKASNWLKQAQHWMLEKGPWQQNSIPNRLMAMRFISSQKGLERSNGGIACWTSLRVGGAY